MTVVPHSSIFRNASHLPTFNSNAIQANLVNIPGEGGGSVAKKGGGSGGEKGLGVQGVCGDVGLRVCCLDMLGPGRGGQLKKGGGGLQGGGVGEGGCECESVLLLHTRNGVGSIATAGVAGRGGRSCHNSVPSLQQALCEVCSTVRSVVMSTMYHLILICNIPDHAAHLTC